MTNRNQRRRLTLFEASATIAGLGIGGGIMAVPYLASHAGLWPTLAILVVAYVISVLFHLMVAQMICMEREQSQLVEALTRVWGQAAPYMVWPLFAVVLVGQLALMSGYLMACRDIIVNATGASATTAVVVAYALSAITALFGLKAVGVSEKIAILAIVAIVAVLTFLSFQAAWVPIATGTGQSRAFFAVYAMAMFAFTCSFSIPEAVDGLAWNPRWIPMSVFFGLTINFVLMTVVTVMAILVSPEVTPTAIVGWCAALGPRTEVFGGLFALLTILTSYWATAYAMVIIVQERLGWSYATAWGISTVPTLFVALADIGGFIEFLRLAGGAVGLTVAILVIPTFRRLSAARKKGTPPSDLWIEGQLVWLENGYLQLFILLAFAVMVVGSFIAL